MWLVRQDNKQKMITRACFLISLFTIIGALCCARTNAYLSDVLFLLYWITVAIVSLLVTSNKSKPSLCSATQMTVILSIISGFWLCEGLTSIPAGTDINKKIAIMGCASLGLMFIVWFRVVWRGRRTLVASCCRWIRENWETAIPSFVFLICCIGVFNLLFKADSNTYYTTLSNNQGQWDFTLHNLERLQLGYHSTYGYSLFAFIGNALIPAHGVGIRLVNIVLTLVSMVLFYDLAKRMLPGKEKAFYLLLMSILVFNPLILGLIQEINIDLPLFCFLIWLVWAHARQFRPLTVFFAFLICFTKECGVVLLFFYCMGILAYRLTIKGKGMALRDRLLLIESYEWLLVLPAVFFLIDLTQFNSWDLTAMREVADNDPNRVNSFSFNPIYIGIRLSEIFLFNFQWVFVGICLFCLVVYHGRKGVNAELFWGVCCSSIGFLLFSILFFTYPHYRYLMPNAFFTTLYLGLILYPASKRTLSAILIVYALLQFGQTYRNIDPVSNRLFRTLPTGSGRVISLAYYSGNEDNPQLLVSKFEGGNIEEEAIRDYVQVNRVYAEFEKCFELFLATVDFSSDDALILSPIFGDARYTFKNMFGVDDWSAISWNPESGQLRNSPNGVSLNLIEELSSLEDIAKYKNVWYLELPYSETFNYEAYREKLPCSTEQEVWSGQWKISFYKVERGAGD